MKPNTMLIDTPQSTSSLRLPSTSFSKSATLYLVGLSTSMLSNIMFCERQCVVVMISTACCGYNMAPSSSNENRQSWYSCLYSLRGRKTLSLLQVRAPAVAQPYYHCYTIYGIFNTSGYRSFHPSLFPCLYVAPTPPLSRPDTGKGCCRRFLGAPRHVPGVVVI